MNWKLCLTGLKFCNSWPQWSSSLPTPCLVFPSHKHGSWGASDVFAVNAEKHLCLEANITDINNMLDQPEKPASGRRIIMKDSGRKGERERASFTHRRMAMGQFSQLRWGWLEEHARECCELSFARAEQPFK